MEKQDMYICTKLRNHPGLSPPGHLVEGHAITHLEDLGLREGGLAGSCCEGNCWWFRNPAITSWYGSFSHYLHGFLRFFRSTVVTTSGKIVSHFFSCHSTACSWFCCPQLFRKLWHQLILHDHGNLHRHLSAGRASTSSEQVRSNVGVELIWSEKWIQKLPDFLLFQSQGSVSWTSWSTWLLSMETCLKKCRYNIL